MITVTIPIELYNGLTQEAKTSGLRIASTLRQMANESEMNHKFIAVASLPGLLRQMAAQLETNASTIIEVAN